MVRRPFGLTCALLWSACLLGGQAEARAQPASPEAPSAEELAEIEAALGADAAQAPPPPAPSGIVATAADLLPDISLVLDVALAWFSDEDEQLQSGGHDPSANGFNLQQLELSMSKSVDPYFRFDTNIVFSLFGVELEEAYATTLALPGHLQIRAGQFLTRFGRFNSTHPHSWSFVDQPFVMGKFFGGEGNRGLGVELSWLSPLPWYVELVGSSTGAAGEGTARSFYGADDQGVDTPLDLQNTLALKQFFDLHHDWSLAWGLSVANGPNPHGKHSRSDIYGTDLYLKYRPITRQSQTEIALHTEALYRRRQIPHGVLQDAGGFAIVTWRFLQRWGMGMRYELGSATFDESGAVTVDTLDPAQRATRHRGASNVSFWPTEFSRLRLQGSVDLPGWLPDPIWAGFLAFEVVVGSHGSHAF